MNVPPELKPIAPYLQRAKEIKVKSQVVAYFCLTYAIKRGIELKASSPESRTFLSELMDRAEKERDSLKGSPEITSDIEGKNIMLKTANDVFQYSDSQEKAGNWTRATALGFLAASNFYEVTRLFGEQLEDEYEQKIKYARFKAAEVHTAIKTGKKPESFQEPASTQPEEYIPPDPSAPVIFPKGLTDFPPISPQSHYTPPVHFTQPSPDLPYNPPQEPHFQPINQHTFSTPPSSHHYQPTPPQNPHSYYPPPSAGPPAHVTAKATKHARHAISAMQFDDVSTAIANLQSAINELMPFHH
ncbi:hypothetical protein DSO57_1015192 [Entomophthora muscae]|uniref:Uncharacterized protein n=2 Tax=Entomophthora muscae TaxID=34485 RepID=A0ACC2S748_9FUNG|nr:hypothetical protein DSO57_1015192 [Entomophthora muscae]